MIAILGAIVAKYPSIAKKLQIEIVEKSDEVGPGLAWSKSGNISTHHLMNAYHSKDGLKLSEAEFNALPAYERELLNDDHCPRYLVGEDAKKTYNESLAELRSLGVDVKVSTRSTVENIQPYDGPYLVDVRNEKGQVIEKTADYVVLASGHWHSKQDVADKPGVFSSPWPATKLQAIDSNQSIAVMGTGLGGVDTILTLAHNAGHFTRDKDGHSHFTPKVGAEKFKVVAHSPHGMLPVALGAPYPLTGQEVSLKDAYTDKGFISLDAMYDLMRKHFVSLLDSRAKGEPEYEAVRKVLTNDSLRIEDAIEEVYKAYKAAGPLDWMKKHLQLAHDSRRDKFAVLWQGYLRHIDKICDDAYGHFSAEDCARFEKSVRPLFVKFSYGTLERNAEDIVALMEAGRLEVRALGEHSAVNTKNGKPGAEVMYTDEHGKKHQDHYGALVKAQNDDMHRLQFSSPLMKKLFDRKHGVLREELHAYSNNEQGKKEYEAQEAARIPGISSPGRIRRERADGGGYDYYLSTGGIAYDGNTMETCSPANGSANTLNKRFYVLGPTAKSQKPLVEGIDSISEQALNISAAIVKDLLEKPLNRHQTSGIQAAVAIPLLGGENMEDMLREILAKVGLPTEMLSILSRDTLSPAAAKVVRNGASPPGQGVTG